MELESCTFIIYYYFKCSLRIWSWKRSLPSPSPTLNPERKFEEGDHSNHFFSSYVSYDLRLSNEEECCCGVIRLRPFPRYTNTIYMNVPSSSILFQQCRCFDCGRCVNGNEYEEMFCLASVCSDCLKLHAEYQEGHGSVFDEPNNMKIIHHG
ncbi:hypothetical protein ACFE04_024632 [Oxalis oulophora]